MAGPLRMCLLSSESPPIGIIKARFESSSSISSSKSTFFPTRECCTNSLCRLSKSHTGKYLAEKLVECLREYGIERKVSNRVLSVAHNSQP